MNNKSKLVEELEVMTLKAQDDIREVLCDDGMVGDFSEIESIIKEYRKERRKLIKKHVPCLFRKDVAKVLDEQECDLSGYLRCFARGSHTNCMECGCISDDIGTIDELHDAFIEMGIKEDEIDQLRLMCCDRD